MVRGMVMVGVMTGGRGYKGGRGNDDSSGSDSRGRRRWR